MVEASVGTIDPKAEEKSIIALLNKESDSFEAKEVDELLTCYISDGRFSRIQQMPNGQGMAKFRGKPSEMRESLMAFFISMDEDIFELKDRLGLEISYSDDNTVATVTYTQIAQIGDLRMKSEEIRTVEREDGEWKILLVSSILH